MDNELSYKVEDLLDQCMNEEFLKNWEKVIELTDEIFKISPDNPIAIGYKSFAFINLKRYGDAMKLLEYGCKLYPENYYLKNNSAILYYEMGDYEKSLKFCEEGLRIKKFEDLIENKLKALIKLDRIGEARQFYECAPFYIDLVNLLLEAGKFDEALDFCIDEDEDSYFECVDKIKDIAYEKNLAMPDCLKGYCTDWIYKILRVNDTRVCPDCGGCLVEILWGLPTPEHMKKAENGEIFLAGCVIPGNPANYHCSSCGHDFDLGYDGLEIESYDLEEYIEYKIDELLVQLKADPFMAIRSLESLKEKLQGFDESEFEAFISHLMEIGFIYEPKAGYVGLSGFKDLKPIKEYPDEGKFAAPRWLAYPHLSAGTIFWRMGAGEDYVMNMPYPTEEFEKLFPMPKNWLFSFSTCRYKPVPLLGNLWSEDGMPKYSNLTGEVKVNDIITMDDEDEFHMDNFTFDSIAQAISLSKELLFDRCREKDLAEGMEGLWETFKYSVCLNAAYYKVMQDEDLKEKLLETGDKNLFYESDDEWGSGENLFGRALMELRDEIRRLYQNAERIDWEYTQFLKYM